MKMTKTVEYGLLAVVYLANNSKDGLVKMSTVAKECGTSGVYLTKAMLLLVKANILTSKRGPRGGHSLARTAKEISMLEIIEALNGLLELKMEISEFAKYAPIIGKAETVCNDANAKVKDILHKAKLSQMIK